MLYCANVTGRNAEVCQCHRKKCCVVPVSQEEMYYATVEGRNVALRQCHKKMCRLFDYCTKVTGRNVLHQSPRKKCRPTPLVSHEEMYCTSVRGRSVGILYQCHRKKCTALLSQEEMQAYCTSVTGRNVLHYNLPGRNATLCLWLVAVFCPNNAN